MARDGEIPLILRVLKKLIDLEISVYFFDLAAARAYAEVLAYV